MREMEDLPRGNYNNKNILVEDEEIQKNNNLNINEIIDDNNNIQENNDISLNIHNSEKINDDYNYFFYSFRKNIIANLIILFTLIVLMIFEIYYKDSLFTYSLTYEQNLQNSLSQSSFEFFKLMSLLGGGVLIGIGLFFILCYFTLIKTIFICSCLILVVYLHDIMKLIYNDPRPFWHNTILFQGNCEVSYGNPSGHSLISFYFFLSFGYYFNQLNFIKGNKIYKIIVYSVAFILSGLIAFSRIALGVHSLDQVLFGSLLGILCFLIFAITLKIYDMPLNHYLKFYRSKIYIIASTILLIVLLIMPFILYSSIDVEKDKIRYEIVMKRRCSNLAHYKFYSYQCLVESLVIVLLCGIYFGQFFFWHLVSENKKKLFEENKNNPNCDKNEDDLSLEESINQWNKYLINVFKSFFTLIKVCLIVCMILIPGIFYVLIPSNNNFKIILLFKFGLPLFLIGFLAFGPCFYALINVLKS